MVDTSGMIQSYDNRATTSAALSRAIMAPHYVPANAYSAAPSNAIITTHQQGHHHNLFGFNSYSGPSPNGMIPAFANNFIQQRPLPRLMAPDGDGGPGMSFARSTRQGFIEEHHSQSPPIKSEPLWTVPTSSPTFVSANHKSMSPITTGSASGTHEVTFGTEVDVLMKAIQAKSKTPQPQTPSPIEQSRAVPVASHTPPYRQTVSQVGAYEETKFKQAQSPQEDSSAQKGGKKRYQCTIENCTKSFSQKTHLDIHERKHTGVKPYACKEPGCGRSFSQLGNLKTHERRHTGERPYHCEICGKRFAQRGNVRAHKIVHDQAKPYVCRLDSCLKQFTQLGNLKSHQNKFHIATIRALTLKFASIKHGDIVLAADKELWEYFANLYKNSNKGIKGRGKDRKVGSNPMALTSSMRSSNSSSTGYSMSGAGRGHMGNMGMGMNQGMSSHAPHGHAHSHGHGRNDGQQYEMVDVDDQGSHSQCGSYSVVSGVASSVGTCYDDAPSDGFEDTGRGGDLAFGDRIY